MMRNNTLTVIALVFGVGALSACGGDKAAGEAEETTQEETQEDTPTEEKSTSTDNGDATDVIGDELEEGVEEAEDMVKDPEGD